MKLNYRYLIIIVGFLFLISSLQISYAFVAKPIDELPGVVVPTPNPNVTPPPTRIPEVPRQQATPIYNPDFGKPTSLPSPIFVQLEDDTPIVVKKKSSNLNLYLFIFGGLVLAGGLVFLYKSHMRG